jgi:Flp pilus assembly protein TadG
MKLGCRGATALEFAFAAPVLLLLLFGCIEYARMLWTWQALQLTSDQTARCVAIGGTACTTPSTYAVSVANGFGAFGLTASDVLIDHPSGTTSNNAACNPPSGNTAVRVRLSLAYVSPVAALLPSLENTLMTTSCYPLTGN